MTKKNLLFYILFICGITVHAQDFNDKIYTKEGDSIFCKITLVKTNWIYYDHLAKKGVRNDYIHMSDLKYYLYNGVRRKAYEYEVKEPSRVMVSKDSSIIRESYVDNFPKDTISSFYIDSFGVKHSCFILCNKGIKFTWEPEKIRLLDSLGKLNVLLPHQLNGYWLKAKFYKSFNVVDNNATVALFGVQLVSGEAELYLYDGAKLNNRSVYIFKKQHESEYHFVQTDLTVKNESGITLNTVPKGGMGASVLGTIGFRDPTLYLKYFQTYFGDCESVLNKFKSKWYSYNDVPLMFRDYNKCKSD